MSEGMLQFDNRLDSLIRYEIAENDLVLGEIIGVLEITKHRLIEASLKAQRAEMEDEP